MVVMPDIMTLAADNGDDVQIRDLQGKMIAHCENAGDRMAILDCAAGHAPAGDPRVADEHRRLRLEVRGALLPVDRGPGSADQPADDGPAVRPRGRPVVPHGLDARRAQGAGQRGRASAPTASASRSRRPSRAASTRSASTASARSRAAASACGARARCPAIPSGATSTSGGSSTSSPSRSWRARSGACSSPTTRSCGSSFGSRRRTSSRACGATGRCSAPRPAQAFYVKCDSETNPPEVIEAGQVICEIGIAPVKPAEFVIFRLSQFSGGEGSAVSE